MCLCGTLLFNFIVCFLYFEVWLIIDRKIYPCVQQGACTVFLKFFSEFKHVDSVHFTIINLYVFLLVLYFTASSAFEPLPKCWASQRSTHIGIDFRSLQVCRARVCGVGVWFVAEYKHNDINWNSSVKTWPSHQETNKTYANIQSLTWDSWLNRECFGLRPSLREDEGNVTNHNFIHLNIDTN